MQLNLQVVSYLSELLPTGKLISKAAQLHFSIDWFNVNCEYCVGLVYHYSKESQQIKLRVFSSQRRSRQFFTRFKLKTQHNRQYRQSLIQTIDKNDDASKGI